MKSNDTLNALLVTLFNDIMDIEQKALITGQFKEISINDMHIIESIGLQAPKNMSSVARAMSVTVGTLTIAINNLVKKGYVNRVRSEEDKRVVLLSLSEKGQAAYDHHKAFHEKMIDGVLSNLPENQVDTLIQALKNLTNYFTSF